MGVATAFVLLKIKKDEINLKQLKSFTFSWHAMKFLLLILVFAAFIIDPLPLESPIVWAALAGVVKLAWGFVVAVLILGYSNGFGGFWRDFMNAYGWKRLSKVNYSVMICHIFVYALFAGAILSQGSFQINYGLLGTMTVFFVGISYAVAVIFHMLVELPAANLFDIWRGVGATIVKENNNELRPKS